MSSHLIDGLGTTDALAAVFSDESVLQAMLNVEAGLARAQARLKIIPSSAATAITTAARADAFDAARLASDARTSGTVIIPLVKALTERVRTVDPESAGFVHWGVTSQDVADTALVLLLTEARPLLAEQQLRIERALRRLSDEHASTVMLGRTLLQPAPPITFGLKVAQWYAAIHRSWQRLSDDLDAASVVQCGGASGTLAALGEHGLAVARELAVELSLNEPHDGPWHTRREGLAAVVTSCGILTGALGKAARDVALLMQQEVGEAAEPGGGSSTMPHKRNPSRCAIVLAAATRAPNLVAAFLSGMVQEHERSVGGWHAEWPTIASVIQTTGAALAAMADVAEGLTVDGARMRANIAATGGSVFSEQIMMLLAPGVGRDRAHQIVADASAESTRTGRPLSDIAKHTPAIAAALSVDQLAAIGQPERYLGAADTLRRRLLETR